MKSHFFGSLLGGLALAFTTFIRSFIVSPRLGIASLPIVPTAGSPAVAALPTVNVAGAIKPTETPGGIIAQLNAQLDANDPDVKFVVLGTVGSPLTRIIMLPTSVSDATALAAETLIGTVAPDEATGDTVTGTLTHEGAYDDRLTEAIAAVNGTAKPRRNVSSLVNALVDALRTEDGSFETAGQVNFALVVDQSTETVKIYQGATVGVVTGELADVSTEAAPPAAGTRSVLRGS